MTGWMGSAYSHLMEGVTQFGTTLKFASQEDEDAAMYDYAIHLKYEEENRWGGDDMDTAGPFNPKPSDWSDTDLSRAPVIFADKARSDIFQQFKDEYKHIMTMLDEQPSEEEDDDDKFILYIFGKNGKIFRCFYDAIGLLHSKFC